MSVRHALLDCLTHSPCDFLVAGMTDSEGVFVTRFSSNTGWVGGGVNNSKLCSEGARVEGA